MSTPPSESNPQYNGLGLFMCQIGKVLLALLVLPGCASGCDVESVEAACIESALCDAPPPPPEQFDVVCDATPGSSCAEQTMQRTLDIVLSRAAEHPGSTVGLWCLGSTFSETNLVETQVSRAPQTQGTKARQRERGRWINEATNVLMKATQACTKERATRYQSPLAEALTKVGLAHTSSSERWWLVVVTDGREMSSYARFECKHKFPSDKQWQARLDKGQVLAPGSLMGAHVAFAFVTNGPTAKGRMCNAVDHSPKRAQLVRERWQTALVRAGATVLPFRIDGPVLHAPVEVAPSEPHIAVSQGGTQR